MSGAETIHNTKAGRVFDWFNVLFLGCCGLITVLPFLYIIAGSFATEAELAEKSFFIFPETFSLDAYRYIFSTPTFIRSMGCLCSLRLWERSSSSFYIYDGLSSCETAH